MQAGTRPHWRSYSRTTQLVKPTATRFVSLTGTPDQRTLHTPLPTNTSAQFPTAISTAWDTACAASLNTRSLLDRTFFHPSSSSSSTRPPTHRSSPFVIKYTSSNAGCARRTMASLSLMPSISCQQCRDVTCSRVRVVVASTLPSASCGYAREYGRSNSESGSLGYDAFTHCVSTLNSVGSKPFGSVLFSREYMPKAFQEYQKALIYANPLQCCS